jgi:hypothetical protein
MNGSTNLLDTMDPAVLTAQAEEARRRGDDVEADFLTVFAFVGQCLDKERAHARLDQRIDAIVRRYAA